jgi:glucuronoarabinoxylan endo-1,4-beta-xylanase
MRNRRFIIIGICLLWLVSTVAVTAQSVTVDLNTEYQSISGFGGANIPGWIDDLSEDNVDKAFGNNPGQMGLTILRIRVPIDTSWFFREVPTAVLAKNHGAIIVASPWSPPDSLKSNNNVVGGYLLPENYGAYADHLLGFASYMNNNGAPLYAISVQNEPDCDVDYESCDWTAQQFVDFLTEQGSKFNTLNIIATESQNFDRTLTDPILNDAEAVQHVDIIGGHLYGGGLYDYPLARAKGKEVWMTEHLTGYSGPELNNWALALYLAKEINDCMIANFSAYI